jgi:hypothetical protein
MQNPNGTSSGALGRRDFVRPEFIAMLNDAGGPCWRYSVSFNFGQFQAIRIHTPPLSFQEVFV